MNVGEKLKYMREKNKKTLRELSGILDVSLNTIYRWEHSLAMPRKSTLRKVAAFYGVSLEEITQDRESENEFNEHIGVGYPSVSASSDRILERELLSMFSKLQDCSKHRVLGYVERIYIESID